MANSGTMRHGDASLGAGKSLRGSLGNPHLITSSPLSFLRNVLRGALKIKSTKLLHF